MTLNRGTCLIEGQLDDFGQVDKLPIVGRFDETI